jgi:hypothetical protein
MIKNGGTPQGMKIAVCIKTEFGRTVIAVSQLLAGIAERLKVPDGVGVLQSGHE